MTTPNKRIITNTGLLYLRMAIIMVINLYAVRLVLNNLGVQDYGIYDVVAGVVTMFQSISGVLSMSTQRFFSFALGEKDEIKLQKVFSSSINVFLVISFVVLLIGESVGLWFINTQLVIPEERMIVANYVYQFSIFSFILTMIQTPFSSVVIAYEDMGIFAIISLADSVLKFLAAFILSYFNYDRLGLYGFFMFVVSLFSVICYASYVFKNYKNCKYSIKNNQYWKDLITFSGWTFVGSSASVGTNQICTIFVNLFFGPITNAARAIGFQVGNALNAFCGNFLMAVRPPMIKAYADNNFDYLNKLFYYSNKIIYFSILILFVPLFYEMDYILNLWLKTQDDQTILFSRLMLVYMLFLSLSHPITYIMHAAGYVKQYHLLTEIPTLAIIPVTYIVFSLGYPAFSTYVIMIIAIIVSHMIRIFCLNKYYPQFELKKYICDFVIRCLIVTIVSLIIINFAHSIIDVGFKRFFLTFCISTAVILLMAYIAGLTIKERKFTICFVNNICKKIKNKYIK